MASQNANPLFDRPNWIFEVVLQDVGSFGRYHFVLWFFGLWSCFLASFNHLSVIFLAFSPDHVCVSDDEQEPRPWPTYHQLLNQTDDWHRPCGVGNGSTCRQWVFDQSTFHSTFVTQFGLVCQRAGMLPVIITSYMSGVITLNLLAGFLSDHLGRKRTCLLMTLVHIASSFGTAYATGFAALVAIRFFVGGSIHAVWTSLFILNIEVIKDSKRAMNGAIYNFGWNIGAVLMTGLAYWLRDWAALQLSFAIPSLVLLFVHFVALESPRWLLNQGRLDLAESNLRRMASFNGVDLDRTEFESHLKWLLDAHAERAVSRSYHARQALEAIRDPRFRRHLLLMMVAWFAVGCSAYGIHFAIKLIDYDIFVTTVIKELVIFVIIVGIVPIYERINKPLCVFLFYLLAGIVGLLLLIPTHNAIIQVALYVLCQSLLVADFYLIDTYTPEIFPTSMRGFVYAILDTVSKVGTLISPFIVEIGGTLPLAVFGGIMMGGSVVMLFTPDITKQPLCDEVGDLAQQGQQLSLFQKAWQTLRREGQAAATK